MRLKSVVAITAVAVVAFVGLTGSASAAYRGQITQARGNTATHKINVKGIVECFRTPGEVLAGTGIFYTDGCAAGEEELWTTISLVVHNKPTAKRCTPGAVDPQPDRPAKSKTVRSFQPEHVENVSFSFTTRVTAFQPLFVCIEGRSITDIPIPGAECFSGVCFFNEIIAGRRIQWIKTSTPPGRR